MALKLADWMKNHLLDEDRLVALVARDEELAALPARRDDLEEAVVRVLHVVLRLGVVLVGPVRRVELVERNLGTWSWGCGWGCD